MYGFEVGDRVVHVKDPATVGVVSSIDVEYDLGGVTTCTVNWDNESGEADNVTEQHESVHWTNKLVKI